MSFLYKHNYSRIAVKPLAEEDRRTRDVVGNVVKTSEVLSERFEPDNSQKNTEKDENSDDRRSEEFRRTRDVAVNVVEASNPFIRYLCFMDDWIFHCRRKTVGSNKKLILSHTFFFLLYHKIQYHGKEYFRWFQS